ASHTLATTPNLGRSCAAGLRGCVSKKSSTSSLMIGGSSSIWREITFIKRTPTHFGFQNSAKGKRTMNQRWRFTETPYSDLSNVVAASVSDAIGCHRLIAAPEHGDRSR